MKQNPIDINPVSNSIIQEIIDLVKYNKSKILTEYVFTKPAKQINKILPRSSEVTIQKGSSNNSSNVLATNMGSLGGGSFRRRSKLRVNNVLIDSALNENTQKSSEKDFVIINSVTHEETICNNSPK